MCGFHNVLSPGDENGEVAPSAYLDIAVSEDNGQKNVKGRSEAEFDAKYNLKTWPKRWDATW